MQRMKRGANTKSVRVRNKHIKKITANKDKTTVSSSLTDLRVMYGTCELDAGEAAHIPETEHTKGK